VIIKTDQNVEEIVVEKGKVKGIVSNGTFHATDTLLSGADYPHTETLLPKKYRQYS
jgi:phytoene desaturase